MICKNFHTVIIFSFVFLSFSGLNYLEAIPLPVYGIDDEGGENVHQPLQISIFYETLCHDSLNFLENQLLDILLTNGSRNSSDTLEAHMDIQLIPYGKAATLETSGLLVKYSFICQHGPLECEGNKMHTCVIENLTPTSSSEQKKVKPSNLVKFLVCSMKEMMAQQHTLEASFLPLEVRRLKTNANKLTSSSIAIQSLDKCFHELKLSSDYESYSELNDTKIKSEIKKCVESDEANSLLKLNGDLTSQLTPSIYFVPWVTFNQMWRKEIMEEAFTDLRKVLCQLINPVSSTTSLFSSTRMGRSSSGKPSTNQQMLKITECEKYNTKSETHFQINQNSRLNPLLSHNKHFKRYTPITMQRFPLQPSPAVFGPVAFIPMQQKNFMKTTSADISESKTTRESREIGMSKVGNYDRRRFIHNSEMDGPGYHQQGWRVFGNPMLPRIVTWRRAH